MAENMRIVLNVYKPFLCGEALVLQLLVLMLAEVSLSDAVNKLKKALAMSLESRLCNHSKVTCIIS